jgi:hypothetical protein
MTGTVAERIDGLDDKQAIFQVKILLQAASRDGTPAMNDPAIADELNTIPSSDRETLAQAAALVRKAPAERLPTNEAGAAARELLHIFAASPGGEAILDTALNKSDESGDFGFITVPLICAFLWLTFAGDFDLHLGGLRYRKKGLTPEQQTKLLNTVLPTAVKSLINSAFGSAKT